MAISSQIRSANEFRWDWVRQTRAYWQMYWRAPAIEPGTPIIAEGALTSFVNRYNAAFAVNLLYPLDDNYDLPSYWYFEVPYDGLYRYIPEIIQGKDLIGRFSSENFIADSRNSLLILTPPLGSQCLWFLTPQDIYNDILPEELREISGITNLDRIHREPLWDDYPVVEILGSEPKHGWCYYFQKASLARQFEDWEQIIDLWNEAKMNSFGTSIGYELIPFIEASAFLEDWDQALELSKDAHLLRKENDRMLCAIWEGLGDTFDGNDEFNLAYGEVMHKLDCP